MTEVAGVQREAGDGPADPEDRLLTVPNVITVVRLLCLPVFLWLLFGREDRVMAAIVLGALGATDWVDGYIARHWNQVSKAGKVLDPVADRLLFFVGGIGIIVDGSIPTWVAVAVLVREVAVSVATIALALAGAARIDVTWWGKAGTFCIMFALPLFVIAGGNFPTSHLFLAVALAALTIFRHRDNVARLMAGTERRLGEKVKPA